GIYCRPSCPAKKPKPENVRFFQTEVDARAAGFRPCRRCRPDHWQRAHDPDAERVDALITAVRAAPARYEDAASLARAAGFGSSKLNTLFRAHYHTTPAALLTRARVAAACTALARNGRNVLEAAYAAGFESVSTFNENFLRQT